MCANSEQKPAAAYNVEIPESKGIGEWRSLYLEYLARIDGESIVDLGAGSPDFLKAVRCTSKTSIDVGNRWANEFRESGIEFIALDLDNDPLPQIGPFDVAICSDVFEHLLYPDRTLKFLRDILAVDGLMFSHVPNEFTLKKTLRIMMGLSDSRYFHRHRGEFDDPHLHRFTKIGFERFLKRQFKYNLSLSHLKYGRVAGALKTLGIPVPYALEGGPTFVSTNSQDQFRRVGEITRRIYAERRASARTWNS